MFNLLVLHRLSIELVLYYSRACGMVRGFLAKSYKLILALLRVGVWVLGIKTWSRSYQPSICRRDHLGLRTQDLKVKLLRRPFRKRLHWTLLHHLWRLIWIWHLIGHKYHISFLTETLFLDGRVIQLKLKILYVQWRRSSSSFCWIDPHNPSFLFNSFLTCKSLDLIRLESLLVSLPSSDDFWVLIFMNDHGDVSVFEFL